MAYFCVASIHSEHERSTDTYRRLRRGRIRRDGHDRRPRDDRQPASQPPGRYPFRRDPRNEPRRTRLHRTVIPQGSARLHRRRRRRRPTLPGSRIRPLRRFGSGVAAAGRLLPRPHPRQSGSHHRQQRQDRHQRVDRPALPAGRKTVPQSEKLQLADRRTAVAADDRGRRADRRDRSGYLPQGRDAVARTDRPSRHRHHHEHRRRPSGEFRHAGRKGRRETEPIRPHADDYLQCRRPAVAAPRSGPLSRPAVDRRRREPLRPERTALP